MMAALLTDSLSERMTWMIVADHAIIAIAVTICTVAFFYFITKEY